jgi:hypothetical protein
MKRHLLTITFSFLFIAVLSSQRSYPVSKISFDPDSSALDGLWPNIPIADSFLTAEPIFKKIPEHATRVQMGYTAKGLWINAFCYSKKVRNDGTFRDIVADADYFSIGLDTWNDDQNAFVFGVTAAGQVFDQRINGDETIVTYNTPWKAKTRITAEGWQAIMFIPFTALRFPKGEQDWGVQFTRFDRSSGELSTWNPQNPMIQDVVWQYGQMEGLEGIGGREKANLIVYGNTSRGRYKSEEFGKVPYQSRSSYIFGGVDGQVGLNTATTLNFTVLPENGFENGFSSYSGYNLASYFPNNLPSMNSFRPLRNDEMALFNRNGQPYYELNGFNDNNIYYVSFPVRSTVSQIKNKWGGAVLNVFKISTQTKNNWRIGIRNTSYVPADYTVILSDSIGALEQRIRPRMLPTSHTITAQKIFKRNNYIHLSTTHFLPGRKVGSNTISIAGQWRDKSNNFEIKGFIYNQNVYRHDDTSYFSNIEHLLSIGKVNGKWKYGAEYAARKEDKSNELWRQLLDIKSIGFIQFYTNYTFFPKNRYFIRHTIGARAFQQRSFRFINPMVYRVNWNGTDKNYRSYRVELASNFKPGTSSLNLGYITISKATKPYIVTDAQFSTDQRKRCVMTTQVNAAWSVGSELWDLSLLQQMRYVMNKYWSINLSGLVYYDNSRNTVVQTINGVLYFATQKPLQYQFTQKQVFALSKKWLFTGGLIITPKAQYLADNNYIVNPNGTITPTPLDYFPVVNASSFNIFLGIDYSLPNGSLFRLAYQNNTGKTIRPNPDFFKRQENNNMLNLQFIWNIHPSERQRG